MRARLLISLVVALTLGAALAMPLLPSAQQRTANGPYDAPGTFSILGFDPETGEVGGAVQSRVFSVGNGVLWAEANVGAVATQATVYVSYGPQGLALLKQNMAPKDIIATLNAEVQKALGGDLRRRLEETGLEVAGSTPEELKTLIEKESAKHAKLIKAANVTPQ